jgi:phosphopantothenoylcysteine decarboxylase/phosphopantothenate--cysteine ligase
LSSLKGKKIILGVTGSIAAYKAAAIIRLLVKEGAEVKVIMTSYAREFITPLTLSTLSKNSVLIDFFNQENSDWNSHIELGLWSDLYLIAPATANSIAKMANGVADNLLLATYLSAKCPVFVAPAMDLSMYKHPSTIKNIELLKSFGNRIIESATGELASGLHGEGRMEDPEKIVEVIADFLRFKEKNRDKLENKKFLITAGPTYEPLDPVRFLGNYSSGKMGLALAEEIAEYGGYVTLVLGPSYLNPGHPNIQTQNIVSAQEMYKESIRYFKKVDCAILTAAVSDFTPENKHKEKVKRENGNRIIKLKPTKDIALELGKLKKENQLLIGFALETHDELTNARLKLMKKKFDFIVLNSLRDEGAGFGYDTNKITIIDKNNKIERFELKSKTEVARDIVRKIISDLK